MAIAAAATRDVGKAEGLVLKIERLLTELKGTGNGKEVEIQWIPGHRGMVGNEQADQEAKKAAKGEASTETK